MSGNTVPFTLSLRDADVSGARVAQHEVHGIMSVEGTALVLQMTTSSTVADSRHGGFSVKRVEGDVQRFAIPADSIRSVELTGLWKKEFRIALADLEVARGIPGAVRGEVVLRLARADATAARSLRADIELAMADAAMRRVTGDPHNA